MTTITLKDAPVGAEFVMRATEAAADLALFFVGEPDDKMEAALEQTRENLARNLAETLGAKNAERFASAFVSTVAGHRAKIEARIRLGVLISPNANSNRTGQA